MAEFPQQSQNRLNLRRGTKAKASWTRIIDEPDDILIVAAWWNVSSWERKWRPEMVYKHLRIIKNKSKAS
jgi:hypothetical protein